MLCHIYPEEFLLLIAEKCKWNLQTLTINFHPNSNVQYTLFLYDLLIDFSGKKWYANFRNNADLPGWILQIDLLNHLER